MQPSKGIVTPKDLQIVCSRAMLPESVLDVCSLEILVSGNIMTYKDVPDAFSEAVNML